MSGVAVVLLHGWGGSFRATWEATGWREALAGRALIGLDLPGHGAGASHDPADYADLAGAVRACLPDAPVDLVGFSLGGKVALALAAADPARIRRLVLGGVGDNAFAPEPDAEPLARALTGEAAAAPGGSVAGLIAHAAAGGADRPALAAVLRRPANPAIDPAMLGRVGDVLLVNGAEDRIARPDGRLRAALRTPHYLSLRGVDHLSLPADAAFRAAAAAFLSVKEGAR